MDQVTENGGPFYTPERHVRDTKKIERLSDRHTSVRPSVRARGPGRGSADEASVLAERGRAMATEASLGAVVGGETSRAVSVETSIAVSLGALLSQALQANTLLQASVRSSCLVSLSRLLLFPEV